MRKTTKCVSQAAKAAERNDVVMMKFWNDQYEYQKRSSAVQKQLKACTLDVIKDRLSVRNPLTTAAYEVRADHIERKRIIYIKKEEK